MPLEKYLPQIDDRRYDDIMDEMRTRIARYTPEWQPVWSDLNDSDPGITMLQVVAWMGEMLLYRMGRVPELNYLKFLQLLGIELSPAESAHAEITFPVKEKHTQPYVVVPLHTQVSGESPEGGKPLVFETERALIALTPRLKSLIAFDGFSYASLTSENESAARPDAQGFLPFGPLARPDSALMLGFGYAQGSPLSEFPSVEIDLAFIAKPSPLGSANAQASSNLSCNLPATNQYASATLVWEFWDGKAWSGLNLLKDETLALTRSGHVRLKPPPKAKFVAIQMLGDTEKYFWVRGRVAASQYERPPILLAVRTNTILAQQAETIEGEVLGGSNGQRDQTFTLSNVPVLAGTLELEVDEGDDFQPWVEVGDFFGSSPQDVHFTLNRTSGQVRFGDGVNGRIPVGNVNNPTANVVARRYRFGGGKSGNLAAGAIKSMVTSVSGIDDSTVSNLLAAHDGRDEENLADAKKRAPQAIKSRCRAVTAEDYEYLATQASSIQRARALPLYHPAFPEVQVPGVITVIVVPDSDEPNPIPSQGTLRTVCAYLNQRRLLTSEVYVVPPTYQLVAVETDVVVKDNADLAEVKQEIEQSLLDYFHPLKGGENGMGWPFGGPVYYSLTYQRVFNVPGVQNIQRLIIKLDGEEAQECRDVPLKTGALAYSTGHQVQVQYNYQS